LLAIFTLCQAQFGVALVSTSSGRLLAVFKPDSGIFVVSVDANGRLGEWHFHTPSSLASLSKGAALIGRTDGNPLLTWVDDRASDPRHGTLHAQVLADDGAAAGPRTTFSEAVSLDSGVFVDDGFERVTFAAIDATPYAIQLFHLGLDGTIRRDAAFPEPSGFVNVAWSGSEIRLIYRTDSAAGGSTTLVQRVTPGGIHIGTVGIGSGADHPADLFPFAIGPDTVVLSWAAAGTDSLNVRRLSSNGMDAWSPAPVMRRRGFFSHAMVRQGGDAVVAWVGELSIGMARINVDP
jgi:hypothetical protein